MIRRHSVWWCALMLAATASRSVVAQQKPPHVMRPYVRMTESDFRKLDLGEPVTRTLDSQDGREVTTFGAVKVQCTADTFTSRVRDIERFKAGEYVLQIGRFDHQPTIETFARLEIDQDDRNAMRTCRPGDCAMRLPADAMAGFRSSVAWNTSAEQEQAARAMREFVLSEARTYQVRGSSGLAPYADRRTLVSRADAFTGLLRPSPFGAEYHADVFKWLAGYPSAPAPGMESFFYWSREKFGLKSVVNLTHSVIFRADGIVVFASKQIFSSHYFDASLGMSVFVPDPADPGAGYVTYMNRTKVETFGGLLAPIVRSVAARRGRDGLARTLLEVRRKLEAGS